MRYYSVIKRNELLINAVTWMYKVMSESSQTKRKYTMFPLTENFRKYKLTYRDRKQTVG